MTLFESIGWLAFGLNVWGNLELTTISNRGHVIRLCSNACWLIYAPSQGAWALFANHCTFACINVLGYYRWHRMGINHCQDHHRVECRICREYIAQCRCHGGRKKIVTLGGPCEACVRQMPKGEDPGV